MLCYLAYSIQKRESISIVMSKKTNLLTFFFNICEQRIKLKICAHFTGQCYDHQINKNLIFQANFAKFILQLHS